MIGKCLDSMIHLVRDTVLFPLYPEFIPVIFQGEIMVCELCMDEKKSVAGVPTHWMAVYSDRTRIIAYACSDCMKVYSDDLYWIMQASLTRKM